MEVFLLSYNQQKWFEQNITDYNKKVPYKAQKIVMMISTDSNPTFISFTMVGNGNFSQLLESNIGFVWKRLDIQTSKGFFSHSNNLPILPDKIFDGYKEHIKEVYKASSGHLPTHNI